MDSQFNLCQLILLVLLHFLPMIFAFDIDKILFFSQMNCTLWNVVTSSCSSDRKFASFYNFKAFSTSSSHLAEDILNYLIYII